MKIVTSMTVFNDSVGVRISITYSEIDEETGTVISDNHRIDRVVTDGSVQSKIGELKDYAQSFVDAL